MDEIENEFQIQVKAWSHVASQQFRIKQVFAVDTQAPWRDLKMAAQLRL
jgi:hypothetical protein